MLRPRPSVSAIPALRRSSWAAVRDDLAAAAGGPLSQQSTARSKSNSQQEDGLSLPLSSQATLHRLQRILSSHEQERLSELFHRSFRGYVTPATLPALLQAAGVSLQSLPSSGGGGGGDGAMDDVIRRALACELEAHGFKTKLAGKSATSTADGGGGSSAAVSSGGQPALHRALSKVVSARRLSARLSARASMRQPFGAGGGLTSCPSTSRDAAQLTPQPQMPIPPTLSFAQVLWVCRVLKDDLDAVQKSTPADANPETLEAFRSCADESTGVVTLRSVQARCQAFHVRLDGASDSHRSSNRAGDDDRDDDRDSNGSGFVDDALNPAQFASLILPSANDVPLISPGLLVAAQGSVPLHYASQAQPRSARGSSVRPQTAPYGIGAGGGHRSRLPNSNTSLLSPAQFVSVPYSDEELEWFQQCDEVYRSPTRNPRDTHCDANPIVNSLLGQSVVTPSAGVGSTSPGRHHHHHPVLGIAPLSLAPSAVTVAAPSGGGGSGDGASAAGRSPREEHSGFLAATGAGGTGGGFAAIPSFVTTVVGGSSSPHSRIAASSHFLHTHSIHYGGAGAGSPLNGSGSAAAGHASNATATLNASYFLPSGSVVAERPFTAPQLGASTTGCARDEVHQARQRASAIARDFPPMRAIVEAGGEGQRFLNSVAERTSHLHRSSLEVRSQASGTQRISVGAENTSFVHAWASSTISATTSSPAAPSGVAAAVPVYEQGTAASTTHVRQHDAPSPQHLQHHSLGRMVDAQRRDESVNPLRAGILGPYYTNLAAERQATLLSAAAAASPTTLGSSLNLDIEFPLHGVSWNKSATTPHLHGSLRHADVLRSLGGDGNTSPGGGIGPEDVVGRLTKLHREKPAVSLHRLHKRLEMLEVSVEQLGTTDVSTTTKTSKLRRGGGSATQRLMRFRRLAGKGDDEEELSM